MENMGKEEEEEDCTPAYEEKSFNGESDSELSLSIDKCLFYDLWCKLNLY
jgi:hypothetical protein